MATMGGVGAIVEEGVKGAEILGEHIPKPRITLKTPTVEDLPDAVPVPPVETAAPPPVQDAEPAEAPQSVQHPAVSAGKNLGSTAGHFILRSAFPELYSATSRGKRMVENLIDALKEERDELIKEHEEEVKKDAQYRRDVNELRFDLSSTNSILKNNGELLRQQLVVQTRSLDLLKEILAASSAGPSSETGAGSFGLSALTGLVTGLIKNPRIALLGGVLTGLATLATGVIMAKRETPKAPQTREVSPESAPSPVPETDSLPYSPISYSSAPATVKQNDNVVTLRASELQYIADTLTFEANKFSFDQTAGTGGGQQEAGRQVSNASLTTSGDSDAGPTPAGATPGTPGALPGSPPESQGAGGQQQQGSGGEQQPTPQQRAARIHGRHQHGAEGSAPQAPPPPELTAEQKTAASAVSSGTVSENSTSGQVLSKLSTEQLQAAGIERSTNEKGATRYKSAPTKAAGMSDPEVAGTIKQTSGEIKKGSVAETIFGGESKGHYGIYNYSQGGNLRVGNFDADNMTVGQVMAAQSAGKINAAGAYQIIPRTMRGAVDALNIDPNTKFDKKLQDKIFSDYLATSKKDRGALEDYIKGKSNNSDAALKSAASEWASIQYHGQGMYGGHNSATVTDERFLTAAKKAREAYAKNGGDYQAALFGQEEVAVAGDKATPEQIATQRTKLDQDEKTQRAASLKSSLVATKPPNVAAATPPAKAAKPRDSSAMFFPPKKPIASVPVQTTHSLAAAATPGIAITGTPTPVIRGAAQVQTPTVKAPTVPSIETPTPARPINKTIPTSYHTPTGVKPGDTSVAALNVHARPPGLSANYYSYLYPHLYGDKAQMSPETQARTA